MNYDPCNKEHYAGTAAKQYWKCNALHIKILIIIEIFKIFHDKSNYDDNNYLLCFLSWRDFERTQYWRFYSVGLSH